jgi:oligosaccharide repeat unit polymerase
MTWLLQVCVLLRELTGSEVSRRLLSLSIVLLLLLQVVNGTRANFVLSVLLLVVVTLLRRGQRWPTPKQSIALIATAGFFFVAKPFARTLMTSGSLWQAYNAALVYSGTQGIALDFQFLDMQAAYMKTILAYGDHLWGRPYLASLVFFIPRAWWATKPSLVEYRSLFSTAEIPISTYGITPNLVGDLYVNFGYVGVALGMLLLATLLTRLYRACASPQAGLARQMLLAVIAVSLVQVYRDGLSSLVLWPFLWFLPLTTNALLGLNLRSRRDRVPSDVTSRGAAS